MTHTASSVRSANEEDESFRQKSFQLQRCMECLEFQYPLRDACVNCLSSKLEWTKASDRGTILAQTVVHISNEEYFRAELPKTICITKLDCGPIAVCFVVGKIKAGDRVRISSKKGYDGNSVYSVTST